MTFENELRCQRSAGFFCYALLIFNITRQSIQVALNSDYATPLRSLGLRD